MKVALIGATGMAGSKILKELVARGHQVTAIARNRHPCYPASRFLPSITPLVRSV